MPLTYDQISSVARNQFFPKAIDNVYASSAFAAILESKCGRTKSGGEKVEHYIEYSENSQGIRYDKGDNYTTNYEDKLTKAVFEWKHYLAPCKIRYTDWLDCKDDSDKVDLIKFEVNSGMKAMKKMLFTDLFADNTSASKNIEGLRKLCLNSDTSKPYGGISTADVSGWALNSSAYDTSTTTMRINTILAMKAAIMAGDPEYAPDIMITTQDVYDRVATELAALGQIQFDNNEKMIALGFKDAGIKIHGLSLYYDAFCYYASATAHYAHFLNTKNLFYTKHASDNMKYEDFKELEHEKGKAATYTHTAVLSCDRRKAFGVFTAINPTL